MPRRANHEGTIRGRRDGRLEAMISLPDGKRKSLYGKTQREVRQRLAAAQRDLQHGLPVVPEPQTLDQYLALWLEDAVKPAARPRTYGGYADLVRLHMAPSLGHRRLSQLSPQGTQGVLNTKLQQGLSQSTVEAHRGAHSRRAPCGQGEV